MSRYIDADALPRHGHRGGIVHWKDIEDTPSIDIVRCRECKWWNCEMSGCKRNPSVVAWRDEDFCSYGEAKESE